jgi:hypothetical protein
MGLVIGQYVDSFMPVLDGVVTVVRNYAQILDDNYCKCYVMAPATPGYQDHETFEVVRFKSSKVSSTRAVQDRRAHARQ